MPWHIVENSRSCPSAQPFAVVKDADGSVEGCHETRQGAEDQMAALYASEQERGGLMEFIQNFVDGIRGLIRREIENVQRAWDGSASNYADTNAYCRACLIDVNSAAGRDEKAQSHCMLPTKRPGSNSHDIEGIMAAAGGRGITRVQKPEDVPQDAWDSVMKTAANTIISQYNANDRTAPESVYKIAGKKPPEERAKSLSRLHEILRLEVEKNADAEGWAWIHDIYLGDAGETFAVASKRGKLYQIPVMMDGDDVSFGEWREVVEEFRPAITARTIVRQQPDGLYRWLSISATSVLNRVGEIDSAALFDSFIAHVQETGEYPIRDFYHLGGKARIGQSDFLARDGVAYINSGLFDDTPIANAIARDHIENPNYWGDSITYLPTSSPEMMSLQGIDIPVYKTGIHRATATLPESRAASWFTNTEVTEVMRMREDILQELERLKDNAGLSAEDFDAFVSAVDGVNREADGMIHREAGESEEIENAVDAEENGNDADGQGQAEQERETDAESEFVLDDDTIKAIGAVVFDMFSAELAVQIDALGLETKLGEITERMAKTENDIRTSVGAIDRRIQALEGAEKIRQDDTPRNQKMRVTYRPRMANAPESDGDNGPAGTMADVAEGTLSNLPSYGG